MNSFIWLAYAHDTPGRDRIAVERYGLAPPTGYSTESVGMAGEEMAAADVTLHYMLACIFFCVYIHGARAGGQTLPFT